jgi:glycine oxidase
MAFEIAPSLADLDMTDSWAGFRPHAEDNFPVLGADEEIFGLFYATGHYRNGILLAPITAKLMADWVIDGRSPLGSESFSPGRFCTVSAGS